MIATSVGGVLLDDRGCSRDADRHQPVHYAGVAGVARRPAARDRPVARQPHRARATAPARAPVRRPGRASRAASARSRRGRDARRSRGLEVHGAVDRDGAFAISPFQWSTRSGRDVPRRRTSPRRSTAPAARARRRGDRGGALADARHRVPRRTPTSTRAIEPLRLVPGIAPGACASSLIDGASGPAVRIVLPLEQRRPGDAWARARPDHRARRAGDRRPHDLHRPRSRQGATVARELVIPLPREAAAALRGERSSSRSSCATRHGTAPTTPVRFRGAVLATRRRAVMDVAIVGAGIAGLGARARARRPRTTSRCSRRRRAPGGHVYTVDADGRRGRHGLHRLQPRALPAVLRAARRARRRDPPDDDGVLGRVRRAALEWGSASAVGACSRDRRRLVDPRHWRFLVEVLALPAPRRGAISRRGAVARRVARRVPGARARAARACAIASWSRSPPRCGRSRPIAAASSRR